MWCRALKMLGKSLHVLAETVQNMCILCISVLCTYVKYEKVSERESY